MASEVLACIKTQEESVMVLPDVSQRKPPPDFFAEHRLWKRRMISTARGDEVFSAGGDTCAVLDWR